MKGPNPFAFLEDNPEGICGRKHEAGVFDSFVRSTSAKQPRVMVVSGGPGVGRTFLLRYFRHEAGKAGLLAPYAKAERGEWAASLIGRIYQETAMLAPFRPGALPDSFEKLVEGLAKGAGGKFGVVVFIDDVDSLRKADEAVSAIVRLMGSLQGRKRVAFVLATTREMAMESPLVTVLPLKPFDGHETRDYVDGALGKGPPKMGEECLHSIREDTGGNPGLLKAVCRHLYDRLKDNERVISKGHYLAYLPYIMSMLSAEWFGRTYQETPAAERDILRVLAKSGEGAHVSDVAKTLRKPLGPVTALTKRLLDSGQIVRLGRGRYAVFSRLYARYVVQQG